MSLQEDQTKKEIDIQKWTHITEDDIKEYKTFILEHFDQNADEVDTNYIMNKYFLNDFKNTNISEDVKLHLLMLRSSLARKFVLRTYFKQGCIEKHSIKSVSKIKNVSNLYIKNIKLKIIELNKPKVIMPSISVVELSHENNSLISLINEIIDISIESDDGLIYLKFREDGNKSIKHSIDLIKKLFVFKIQCFEGSLSYEDFDDNVTKYINSYFTWSFNINFDMLNKFKSNHYIIPGRGLCGYISDYAANLRGESEANTSITTFNNYIPNKLIDKKRFFNQLFSTMSKLENNYNCYEPIIHSHDVEKTFHMLKRLKNDYDSNHKVMLNDMSTFLHNWSSECSMGLLCFLDGTRASLLTSKPYNMFVHRLNEPNSNPVTSNYMYLKRYFPIQQTRYINGNPFNEHFTIEEIYSVIKHNNNILCCYTHFGPVDWPNEISLEFLLKKVFDILIKKVIMILMKDSNDNLNSLNISAHFEAILEYYKVNKSLKKHQVNSDDLNNKFSKQRRFSI